MEGLATSNSTDEDDSKILKMYERPIVHLRSEYKERRLSLVLGAGFSEGFKVPGWKELADRIAKHFGVSDPFPKDAGGLLAARTEVLYRTFCDRECKPADPKKPPTEGEIKGKWFEFLRNMLYQGVPAQEALEENHPYFRDYLKIIITSPVTITYNFDSCIEMCLEAYRKKNRPDKRLYETVFPDMLPSRSSGSIYHVNGFLPRNPLEVYSEDLVFTEQQLADQFLETTTGRYATLAHYFANNTCLLIGLSLHDENIRHFLRLSAINHPGHYHYYVDYQGKDSDGGKNQAILDYYFEAFNLITLPFSDTGIASLGRLITRKVEEVLPIAKKVGARLKWFFYVTGIPSSGKSSVRRSMRGLSIYPEWLDEPIPELQRRYDTLTAPEKDKVDRWVADQFKRRNEKLTKEREGLFLIDRSPLDPLSFTKDEDMRDKVSAHWDRVVPPGFGEPLQEGSIILLIGDPQKVSSRLARKTGSTEQTPEYLEDMQEKLKKIYPEEKGAWNIDTKDKSQPKVVQEVARIIHRKDYQEVALVKDEIINRLLNTNI